MSNTVEDIQESYAADGSDPDFSFSFKVFNTNEVKVYTHDGSENPATQVNPVDYTVNLNPQGNGGEVVFNDPPANGLTVIIRRASDFVQESEYDNSNNGITMEGLEAKLDDITSFTQELKDQISRSLKLPFWLGSPPLIEPLTEEPEDGQFLMWQGGKLINQAGTIDLSNYYTKPEIDAQQSQQQVDWEAYADQSELDAIASANAYTDSKVAADIEVTPSGNLSATNVQDGLEELQSDIDGFTSDMLVPDGSGGRLVVSSDDMIGTGDGMIAGAGDLQLQNSAGSIAYMQWVSGGFRLSSFVNSLRWQVATENITSTSNFNRPRNIVNMSTPGQSVTLSSSYQGYFGFIVKEGGEAFTIEGQNPSVNIIGYPEGITLEDDGDCVGLWQISGTSYMATSYTQRELKWRDNEVSSTTLDFKNSTTYDDITSNTSYSFANLKNGKTLVLTVYNSDATAVTVSFSDPVISRDDIVLDIQPSTYNVYTFVRSNDLTFLACVDGLS